MSCDKDHNYIPEYCCEELKKNVKKTKKLIITKVKGPTGPPGPPGPLPEFSPQCCELVPGREPKNFGLTLIDPSTEPEFIAGVVPETANVNVCYDSEIPFLRRYVTIKGKFDVRFLFTNEEPNPTCIRGILTFDPDLPTLMECGDYSPGFALFVSNSMVSGLYTEGGDCLNVEICHNDNLLVTNSFILEISSDGPLTTDNICINYEICINDGGEKSSVTPVTFAMYANTGEETLFVQQIDPPGETVFLLSGSLQKTFLIKPFLFTLTSSVLGEPLDFLVNTLVPFGYTSMTSTLIGGGGKGGGEFTINPISNVGGGGGGAGGRLVCSTVPISKNDNVNIILGKGGNSNGTVLDGRQSSIQTNNDIIPALGGLQGDFPDGENGGDGAIGNPSMNCDNIFINNGGGGGGGGGTTIGMGGMGNTEGLNGVDVTNGVPGDGGNSGSGSYLSNGTPGGTTSMGSTPVATNVGGGGAGGQGYNPMTDQPVLGGGANTENNGFGFYGGGGAGIGIINGEYSFLPAGHGAARITFS